MNWNLLGFPFLPFPLPTSYTDVNGNFCCCFFCLEQCEDLCASFDASLFLSLGFLWEFFLELEILPSDLFELVRDGCVSQTLSPHIMCIMCTRRLLGMCACSPFQSVLLSSSSFFYQPNDTTAWMCVGLNLISSITLAILILSTGQ